MKFLTSIPINCIKTYGVFANMSNVIYAIKTYELSAQDLTIKEIKLGRTTNIKSTMAQYNRSHREPEILDMWRPNEDLTLSKCEKGVLDLAERYAHERNGETFRFLQDGYHKFSDTLSSLLVPVSIEDLKGSKEEKTGKKEDKSKSEEKEDYIGEKPEFFVLGDDYIEVKSWRNLVEKVAKKIYEENDDFKKALEITGRTRSYFSKDRESLTRGNEIPGTDYYFEANLNANRAVRIIETLIEKFGYDVEEDFKLGLK